MAKRRRDAGGPRTPYAWIAHRHVRRACAMGRHRLRIRMDHLHPGRNPFALDLQDRQEENGLIRLEKAKLILTPLAALS